MTDICATVYLSRYRSPVKTTRFGILRSDR